MLFTTDKQLLVSAIFLALSVVLCFFAVFLYFLARFIKNSKLKYAYYLFADFAIIALFTLAFIVACTNANYGIIRWYILLAYFAPIALALHLAKRKKLAKLFNIRTIPTNE